MDADESAEGENGDFATLDFGEMLECIVRCAYDKYKNMMETWLPSHDRYAMTLADVFAVAARGRVGRADKIPPSRRALPGSGRSAARPCVH